MLATLKYKKLKQENKPKMWFCKNNFTGRMWLFCYQEQEGRVELWESKLGQYRQRPRFGCRRVPHCFSSVIYQYSRPPDSHKQAPACDSQKQAFACKINSKSL